ncbi:hypothetical protein [Amycolatopsis vastitatis]|uniref:Uncharacterized protein n=1 Tax=Amycolatopsis vastitatis TaxID=1905142 RepID=A0A229SJV8_9PSEU|nr:hypothetical protein [Amycolatopsis vastitatis]OXM59113.1 hypothetical protein CF165_49355 [Amycolatopsis vastitatis]
MHPHDSELLDRILLTASQCHHMVDALQTVPPGSATYTRRLRQFSQDLGELSRTISQRIGTLATTAIEQALEEGIDELAEQPELPTATHASLLAAIRSAAVLLDQHATHALRNNPPDDAVATNLALAFPTVALMSLITAMHARCATPEPGGM